MESGRVGGPLLRCSGAAGCQEMYREVLVRQTWRIRTENIHSGTVCMATR